ncbi:MAG: glycosyltransferase [Candidatus Eisenbacteria bacterium]
MSDLAARSGDGIIRRHVAVSGEIRDLLVEHRWTRPRKIVCIPNRLPRMPNGAAGRIVERRELVVGSVANFREQKDHATLLRAFARCLQHRSDIRLLLVGDGTTRPAALALARELGIEARVDFRGYMGVPDAAYREMDVFVLSSHYEGQGIVVLEAMAHGLPVVATDLPAIRETMEGCEMEMLVPSRDPDAMSSAILKLLESPSLRADMAQMARRAAARLGSTEDWARSLIDLYTAVLGER